MATKSKHRKGHKEKVAARNNQKLQEKAHQKHRMQKMIEQMIKAEQEKREAELSNSIESSDVEKSEIVIVNEQ